MNDKIHSFSELSKIDLAKIFPTLKEIIETGINDSKRVVFICGKDKSDLTSFRYKVSSILEEHTKYQLAYPEDLFEDLLEGQAANSLLSLEAHLADAVDLIILIPESPGSFAELGAFSMIQELSQKMLVLRQGRYKSDKSFINHGPIRLVKSYKGKVMDLPFDFEHSNPDCYNPILIQVKKMMPHGRRKKTINNILLFHNYILLFVYLFDKIDTSSIYKLLGLLFEKKLNNQEEIGCKAAIHALIRSQHVDKVGNFLYLTKKGFDEIPEKYFALSDINELRIKIMNIQL